MVGIVTTESRAECKRYDILYSALESSYPFPLKISKFSRCELRLPGLHSLRILDIPMVLPLPCCIPHSGGPDNGAVIHG